MKLLFAKAKNTPLAFIRAYNTLILNVGMMCSVLMYSEPLGNKQSRTLKTKCAKHLNTLSF